MHLFRNHQTTAQNSKADMKASSWKTEKERFLRNPTFTGTFGREKKRKRGQTPLPSVLQAPPTIHVEDWSYARLQASASSPSVICPGNPYFKPPTLPVSKSLLSPDHLSVPPEVPPKLSPAKKSARAPKRPPSTSTSTSSFSSALAGSSYLDTRPRGLVAGIESVHSLIDLHFTGLCHSSIASGTSPYPRQAVLLSPSTVWKIFPSLLPLLPEAQNRQSPLPLLPDSCGGSPAQSPVIVDLDDVRRDSFSQESTCMLGDNEDSSRHEEQRELEEPHTTFSQSSSRQPFESREDTLIPSSACGSRASTLVPDIRMSRSLLSLPAPFYLDSKPLPLLPKDTLNVQETQKDKNTSRYSLAPYPEIFDLDVYLESHLRGVNISACITPFSSLPSPVESSAENSSLYSSAVLCTML